ncbi:ImmA/IrrE family metallo-endopeptidase [Sphingomonas sp. MMS24-J45]|uniref:ImmA/IrrE family metallo-endopeptidase n=1 Tax=Sphingomonas sp. MMS24-J45 TaxID=3238806 RepID=UPI00384A9038
MPIGLIAQKFGIEVISITLPADISGLIRQLSTKDQSYQIQVNNTDVPVRQRFTVAHEIGHFLLHKQSIGTDGITDSILYRSKLSDRLEAEANRMAAALLLPWDKVHDWCMQRHACLPASGHLDEIASVFKVSALAVGFRFGF